RQRRHGLQRVAADEVVPRVGLVELLAAGAGWRRLVLADQLFEAPPDYGCRLRHQELADQPAGVRQAVRKAAGRGVQQQPRRLNRVAGHHHRLGPLLAVVDAPLGVRLVVADADRSALAVDRDLVGHALRPDLGAVLDRIGNMADQDAALGADLAAEQAEAAHDAVRALAERPGRNGDRASGDDRDPELDTTLDQFLPSGAGLERGVGVAVRLAPRIIGRAGDGVLLIHLDVVRLQVVVADRPVHGDAIQRSHPEVRGMEAGAERGVVNGAAADPAAGVVGTQLQGLAAAGDPQVVPVQPAGAGLVRHHVRLAVVPRPRFQGDD